MPTQLEDKPKQIYDDEKSPGNEGWYSGRKQSDTDEEIEKLEKQFDADSAKPEDLPDGHPSNSASSKKSTVKSFLPKKSNKRSGKLKAIAKKKLLYGGVGGALTALIIGLFIFLLPVARLEAIFANVNQRVFGFASSAVEARMGYLFERYLISYTLNLESCTSQRSFDCRAPIQGGLTAGLYNAWKDTRIEQKFFAANNIEIVTNNNPDPGVGEMRHRAYVTIDGQRTPLALTTPDANGRQRLSAGSREFGREMRVFLRENTAWYQVMQRRSVRKYLSRKHDVRLWCFLACQTRDNIDQDIADVKTRYRYRFIDRFVYPFSGKIGLYLDCLSVSDSSRCSTENLRNNGVDRTRISDADAQKLITNLDANRNQSLSRFLLSDIAEKYLSRLGGQRALNAIPVVGQIYLLAWVVNTLANLDDALRDGKLSQMAADINSRQYIEYYQGMRSDSDALKAGELSMEEVGVLVESLEGAEQSLVNQAYNGTPESQLKRDYGSDGYVCQDGEPIQPGEYVCEEKKVAKTFAIEEIRDDWRVDIASNVAFGTYRFFQPAIEPIIKGIDKIGEVIIGGALDFVIAQAERTAWGRDFIAWVTEKGAEAVAWVTGKIFPLPVTPDSPGREKMDAIHAGGEATASEFAKGGYTEEGDPYGLGGVELSEDQMIGILTDQYEQERFAFENESLYTRMTSLEYSYSLASQFFIDTPVRGPGQTMQNIASLPFSSVFAISGNIGSLFSGRASAETWAERQARINPFGISRYGYPVDHPALTMDPDELTAEVCEEYRVNREANLTDEDKTGFESYTIADPCLLELTVIEAGGALFMDEDLDTDRLLDTGSN